MSAERSKLDFRRLVSNELRNLFWPWPVAQWLECQSALHGGPRV